jgi:hypothetical protein
LFEPSAFFTGVEGTGATSGAAAPAVSFTPVLPYGTTFMNFLKRRWFATAALVVVCGFN